MSGAILPRGDRRRVTLVLLAALFLIPSLTAIAEAGTTKCTIRGSRAADLLRGTAGPDVLCGLGGGDDIFGMAGDAVLLGGSGNDTFWPGKGDDRIDGGPGPDAVSYGFAHAPIVVRLYDHSAKGQGGIRSIALLRSVGGPRDDCLIGNNGPNLLFGEAGNDAIFGLDGHHRLAAGREGGAIVGGGGPDWIQGSHASDSQEAGDPPCFLDPDRPVRSGVYGSNGNDRITGGDGRDVVDGGPGADRLFGGDGADRIDGRRGFDRASGGKGSDECLHVEVRRSC